MKTAFYSILKRYYFRLFTQNVKNVFLKYFQKFTKFNIVCSVLILFCLNISCKTCKCPAYAQTINEIQLKSRDFTQRTDHFFYFDFIQLSKKPV